MLPPLCDHCGERPATVFITKVINNDSTRHRYCEVCARDKAQSEGWLAHLAEQLDSVGALGELPDEATLESVIEEALARLPAELMMQNLLEGVNLDAVFDDDDAEGGRPDHAQDEKGADAERRDSKLPRDERAQGAQAAVEPDFTLGTRAPGGSDEAHQSGASNGIGANGAASPRDGTARCPHCGTTWDRLKQDGRAGCAACYGEFRDLLQEVMTRLQRAPLHAGKVPRAAVKRRLRLDHLRQRRDHQLEVLNQRLHDAVAAERYEEAARLRDRIAVVVSTIVTE